jgi:hypothetical protein
MPEPGSRAYGGKRPEHRRDAENRGLREALPQRSERGAGTARERERGDPRREEHRGTAG